MVIVYALLAATAFGISDYLGGSLSRKDKAECVTASTQIVAALFYLMLALLLPGELSIRAIGFGLISGICTTLGLFFLYKTLAEGVVGLVASTASLCTGLIPALWGFLRGDVFSASLGLGIVIALIAVIFLTRGENHESQNRSMTATIWLLTILAGVLLASSTIALSHTVPSDGFWPLVGLSLAAIPSALVLSYSRTKRIFVRKANTLPVIAIAAITALAYFGQVNAVRTEILAIASVVGALYPLPTIILARLIDKEKLSHIQWAGAVLSLIAIGVIALV